MKDRICRYKYHFLYVLTYIVACLPLCLGRIPVCGDKYVWLAVPYLVNRISERGTTLSVAALLLLIQLGTLICAICFFRKLFQSDRGTFFGTLFYMTLPYRYYLVYDSGEWGRAIAFMLLPLFARLLIEVYNSGKKKSLVSMLAAGLVWAAVAYSDWAVALILASATVISTIWYKKWMGLLPIGLGVVLYLPEGSYLLQYFLKGGMEERNLPLGTIMDKGYHLGRFLTSFMYKDGLPGIGLGLLGAMVLLIGMAFVGENFKWNKRYSLPALLAALLGIMSLSIFPWDLVQRLGMPFVRVVGLLESPAVFFGFAGLLLSVLGAYSVEAFSEAKKEQAGVVRVLLAVAALGATVYMSISLI